MSLSVFFRVLPWHKSPCDLCPRLPWLDFHVKRIRSGAKPSAASPDLCRVGPIPLCYRLEAMRRTTPDEVASGGVPARGMVDLHGHILPGIDDGARDLEQALNMARLAVADGIAVSVATPHHLNGVYINSASSVRDHCRAFRNALNQHGIALEILPGNECHLVPELPEALAAGTALTLGDRGRAVLVELPVHTVPLGATGILEEILALGLQPVVAHPERNAELAQDAGLLAEWVEMGCLAQVTSQSCSGRFGPLVQQAAKRMVCDGLVHVIASDAHRDRRRVPVIQPGRDIVAQWTCVEVASLMTETIPRALALGQSVDLDPLIDALPVQRTDMWGWLRTKLGK